MIRTADLCDDHDVRVAEPIFSSFGLRGSFGGPVSTVRVFEDNVLVRRALEEPGLGRVLVVDGGGSLRCALLGDRLAALARDNDWAGVVVNGCIRDSAEIDEMEIGVRAIATHPRKSVKRGEGERDVPVALAGVRIAPGEYLYADFDGVIVSPGPLLGEGM